MNALGINTRIVLAVFATWRVTHLLASEDGPGDFIYRLRAKLGESFAGRLMDCFYCLSLWVAAASALAITRDPLTWALLSWAISGAACILERATRDQTVVQNVPLERTSNHALLWPEEREIEEQFVQLAPELAVASRASDD